MSEPRRGPRGPLQQLPLFEGEPAAPAEAVAVSDPDADARAFAVDPRNNVVLEASAGTGKTSVLVSRYVNLLKAGIDPANILAITFTRKAAAEMRERILRELRTAAERSELDRQRWLELRDRLSDIAISTIDAFCLSLVREFPLEADVDPGFDMADETEVPRLVGTALDRAMRIFVSLARTDEDVALVLAQLGIARTRDGLSALVDRRLVAWDALERFLVRGPRELSAAAVCRTAARSLHDTLLTVGGGLTRFLAEGPSAHPRYELLLRAVRRLEALAAAEGDEARGAGFEAETRAVIDRIAGHFLTNEGGARKPGTQIHPYKADHYPSKDAAKRHRDALFALAPRVEDVMFAFARDLNVVLARGIRRMLAIALEQYRQALEERSVLDFSDVLEHALQLLRRMDEFSQSRFRLESRYHHVLVDEFQDTSRAQWELVSLLVQAWGEGLGLAANPSIFIVGDRKQSIYRFRDADVAVIREAGDYITGLRPGSRIRRSIVRSFRAVPALQHFVNDLFTEMSQGGDGADQFTYDERDRFPVDLASAGAAAGETPFGLAVADTPEACAAAVAEEISQVLATATVRDKATGLARPARAGDIAILFRSRSSHREFERELGMRGIPTYVYKGLGFFDADEIKDLTALVRYLADPSSSLRAAALLRSRFIRLSDAALAALAPELADALLAESLPEAARQLDAEDTRVLEHARRCLPAWLDLVDRIPPAELLDRIVADTAYALELDGPRRRQAWENVKKMRSLVRRIQNRGYITVQRLAEHLMSLTAGDESNAVIEALDSVNLMTVHASKGLEFPIVFVVNLAKGASGPPRPVRVVAGGRDGEPSVTVGPFLSDTDEAERERERHETRRLLYVGLTRARDRLYLGTTLKDGAMVPGRGSLAEVLPESLKMLFAHAGAVFPEVDTIGWTGTSGHEYTWRLCRPPAAPAAATVPVESVDAPRMDDFGVPRSTGTAPRASASNQEEVGREGREAEEPTSDRLVGRAVHRLIEWTGHAEAEPEEHALDALIARTLRDDERVAVDDWNGFVSRVREAWRAAGTRGDVTAALAGEARDYEVPFSLHLQAARGPRLVRGTIDCVVRKSAGEMAVVEFKTGAPRSAHGRQLDVYVAAVRRLYPGMAVEGILLYL